MKKFSFLMLAVAGMLFAACSADRDVAEGPQNELLPEGYMSLNINLPTAPPSMKAANDVFQDGKPTEYNVKDCAVLLFQGKDEASATLFSVQTVSVPEANQSEGDVHNVTTTYKPVARIKGFDTDNNLYALAVLNYKNVLTIDVEKDQAKIDDTNITTLSEIRTATTDANLTTRNGNQDYFFMTNAVLSKAPGGNTSTTAPASTDIFQLAQLNSKNGEGIFETEEDALEHPAGEIFVERAVAKATLKLSTDLASNKKIGTGDGALEFTDVTWTIDNMEPTTYVARNPGDDLNYISYFSGGRANNYRFVGNLSTKYLKTGSTVGSNANVDNDFYRTYWCVDPQYKVEATDMEDATGVTTAADGETPLYCRENTFDVAHQTYKNTTRAIIKVQLSDKTEFYTINGGDKDTKENAEAAIKDYIFNKTAVLRAFRNQLNDNQSYEVKTESFVLEFAPNKVTGQYEISKLEASDDVNNTTIFKSGAKEAINTALAEAKDIINNEIIVRVYTGGVMYYVARFKHFAGADATDQNDLAPWKSGADWETAPETSDAYHVDDADDKATKNYLGRYGMVRNNWYEVEITGFNKLGYPADPSGQVDNPFFDDPDTTDDSFEEIISTKIHVLSWAVRGQSWSL